MERQREALPRLADPAPSALPNSESRAHSAGTGPMREKANPRPKETLGGSHPKVPGRQSLRTTLRG